MEKKEQDNKQVEKKYDAKYIKTFQEYVNRKKNEEVETDELDNIIMSSKLDDIEEDNER